MRGRCVAVQVLLLIAGFRLGADTAVHFYATVSSSGDTNMLTMTTDLFYTQLQTIDGYLAVDRRDTPYTAETATGSGIAFFAEIQEASDGSWVCTLNAVNADTNRAVSATKTYASYYRILMDAKPSLENILTNVTASVAPAASVPEQAGVTIPKVQGKGLDSLAGTWGGETLIDKVVILRGGRGFVIFKNGASMNISVSIEGNSVVVRQNGRSNASFFPEISRELALKNAASADPISWNLTIVDDKTMRGTKTTLVEDTDSTSGISTGTLNVQWTKRQ